MAEKATTYYVPHSSPWPIFASIALGTLVLGLVHFIQQNTSAVDNDGSLGGLMFLVGVAGMITVLSLWWRDTITESLANMNSAQMDVSYRMGMMWFIFSEVMFFAAFFGALFYVRNLAVPWLAGEGSNEMTNALLWPEFEASWPLLMTPGGDTTQAMGPWGLPLINTIILITSSVTCTFAHHAVVAGDRAKQVRWLGITLILGYAFLVLQGYEYKHAYQDLGLTLDAGIYGSTFFMLTGFHGLHVTMGATMLTVMYFRSRKGHLTPDNHFAFEAAAWYWHFVDVVWVFLFIFVYWL